MVNNMFNITSGVAGANVQLNKMNRKTDELSCTNPYTILLPVNSEILNLRCENMTLNGEVQNINQNDYVFGTAHNIRTGGWKYFDHQVPVNYFYLKNPINFGSNGISFSLPNMVLQRYFFHTGYLTGCSAAVLAKGDRIIFVHTGSSSNTDGKTSIETRDLMLLRMVFHLENLDDKILNKASFFSIYNCCYYLSSLGYEGLIAHNGDDRGNCSRVTLASYKGGQGYLCCAINERKVISVSLVKKEPGKKGNISYSEVTRLYDL